MFGCTRRCSRGRWPSCPVTSPPPSPPTGPPSSSGSRTSHSRRSTRKFTLCRGSGIYMKWELGQTAWSVVESVHTFFTHQPDCFFLSKVYFKEGIKKGIRNKVIKEPHFIFNLDWLLEKQEQQVYKTFFHQQTFCHCLRSKGIGPWRTLFCSTVTLWNSRLTTTTIVK